ncbi:hypothetical protein IRR91_002999 [Salmonella enterica]|nr:hypothetical protein [Salmonella enterica]EEH4415045.1 hypothetical protein [Salmonella enterica subsp. arizonae]EGY0923897.1 hypothetical protein [Salmonella enterica subsp. enterica]EHA0607552.1 hypothetical protein [Salmonella enterica subsp. arizonae serovar 48:z4,z24:-]EHA8425843.1 hypothetical protein [Salmonella enterica subsp. arizonae serovar 41:z4,z23:-]
MFSLSTVRVFATHFPPKLLVITDRQVFWLSVILARPSQSCDQWFLRGRQHHSSGGCGGF